MEGGAYVERDIDSFRDHVDQTINHLKSKPKLLKEIDRIFIGAGNALSADTMTLTLATQYALLELYKAKKLEVPRRLALYGNTNDILMHGGDGMKMLNCGGLCGMGCSPMVFGEKRGVDVVYWGIESGNDRVLKVAGKGYNANDAAHASDILRYAGVRPSVMIMPGLGGEAYSDEHVRDTVALINYTRPTWVTFIGLDITEGTPYQRWIDGQARKGLNRRM